MARYYPVSPLYWADDKVARWPDEAKLLALYLLTCQHRNLEGLYRLPVAYIQADLSWAEDDVYGGFEYVVEQGFAEYDYDAKVVFLPKALKYHQPSTDPQVQGAINALQSVPDTRLYDSFLAAAREYAPRLYEALGEPLTEPLSQPLTEGVE
jgi:hypothetical protein